ncbi:murein biosynthesis integral membrane protein MurJ [Salinibacterium sp. UTAS2018]|uniref:murein biosynthesis integral membrane protein MurJ n=1 Tax=Salinibacterium sp. UTAS2018 TaxID=2508880 RepID=UPI0010097B8C|nr:murein biosynthesis integral membrane protein MurJ [Salinibacterium sp. UTAS2018]QAV70658.1 murein biosynthesis integral membrane protein MurJ [Salinibacterium sp. UTAS2018]
MTNQLGPDAEPAPGLPTASIGLPDPKPASIGRASALLASGTFVSRILGFLSALLLARTLGITGGAADAYGIANQLPKSVYAIVAGGMLSAVIVPQIVRAAIHKDGGQKFINRLVTLGLVIFLVVTLAATLSAPLLVDLYTSASFGSNKVALATAFAYWCLPQILFYALYSLFGEVLNARGKFGPFTWAPVVNNVVMLAGLVVFSFIFGSASGVAAADWTPGMIALLAGSATMGIVVQASLLAYFWRRAGLRYRPEFQWRGVGLGRAGKAAAWTFGMIMVTQVGGVVESVVASQASGDNPSVFLMSNAWLIFMLPHSVIAVSIGMAYFTQMSGHARDNDLVSMRSDVSSALRSILMLLVFAAIGLMVIAVPFSALFGTTYAQIMALAGVLVVYLIGLVPFSMMYVLQRVFYSFEDTRTPFFLQSFQIVLYVAAALVISTFPVERIAMSLALAISIAGTIQTTIALFVLRKRLPGFEILPLLRRLLWFATAMIPAAAAGVGILLLLGGFGEGSFVVSSFLTGFISIAVAGIGMLLVYSAVLALTKNDEFLAFVRPIVARLTRR